MNHGSMMGDCDFLWGQVLALVGTLSPEQSMSQKDSSFKLSQTQAEKWIGHEQINF
jgi:hypothetical protein